MPPRTFTIDLGVEDELAGIDQHIHANEIVTLTTPVNIFDEKAFDEAVAEQTTPASKADMIASLTQRWR